MLEFVRIEVGDGQGLGCASCAQLTVASYHSAAHIVARIRAAAEAWGLMPGPNVVLCGPEPFAHPELPVLVAACVDADVERIVLETDGAALSISANSLGVLRAGVRQLRIRLLATDETLGDRLGGRPGRTRDALAGIDAYLAAAGDADVPVVVTAVVPVCAHTIDSLPGTISMLAAHGLSAVRLVAVDALPASAGAVLAAACDTGMVNGLWVEADPALPLPSTHALHLVPDGDRDV